MAASALREALNADEYALMQMYVEFKEGLHNEIVCDDYFFRRLPFNHGYAVYAGLERFLDYLKHLRFTEEDLDWIKTHKIQDEAFIEELRGFRFTGNVWAMREGEIVFPQHPILRIETRSFEAYLIEMYLLAPNNHETLIATKASRMIQSVREASGRWDVDLFPLVEFGGRRAHGPDAAVRCARAAYIAGFAKTSNMKAGDLHGVPSTGTMAHRFIQRFEGRGGQLAAFRAYARWRPEHTILLVDTYDVLGQGIPDAIIVGKELESGGHRLLAVRIDSGDLAYLAREARRMLDEAGLDYVKIVASGDLDEDAVAQLIAEGAPIDMFGIGTKLVTGDGDPSLGGVDKIAAQQVDGEWMPLIKVSESLDKTTTPGRKTVWRAFNAATGEAVGDFVTMIEEDPNDPNQAELHQAARRLANQRNAESFFAVQLPKHVVRDGSFEALPSATEARTYHLDQISRFSTIYRRKDRPDVYPVILSPALQALKRRMVEEKRTEVR